MRTDILFQKGSAISEKCALIDIRKVLIFKSCILTSDKCALTAIVEKCTLIFKKDAMMCSKYAL